MEGGVSTLNVGGGGCRGGEEPSITGAVIAELRTGRTRSGKNMAQSGTAYNRNRTRGRRELGCVNKTEEGSGTEGNQHVRAQQ
ncbi:hypothetical protein NDU88_006215 [Pleurodeles waltl]|uniref:Uncharacterized protein n=1 Tax=Pleurodeles waltl TaxID=8319 RepID=A0AAV7MJ80_PLEWA|nr:hypothetical protein NDU88_006215 [Pleurodeles waltl]